jgi:DNA-binding NarL/FixJ family response regulator
MAIRLVLIDDHSIVLDGLRLRLEQESDFKVVGTATRVEDGYAVLQETAADVVILDLNMPGEGGLSAIARIRERWPATRIIVLTGDSMPNAANDAILAGANGFLRKEDLSAELVRAVRIVAGGKVYLSADAATALTAALHAKAAAPAEQELSERETAVLKGLAEGRSYKEIASELGVTTKSVETYRGRVVKKTGCTTRAELVRYAIQKGILKA